MDELLELLQDAKPDIDFLSETALIDDGLLDSFDVLFTFIDSMPFFVCTIKTFSPSLACDSATRFIVGKIIISSVLVFTSSFDIAADCT